ncbi:MAG TPA: SMP-30/gluconolactonase/LRE family protein, partial [Polyangiaceae bacterium LLY-WYZ-15_(1-7)]|nr:SMP-30/gluconolactonase/LRE family protein [Polyangiaceae bacterium LLY-WYZ-15_(1-7)]
ASTLLFAGCGDDDGGRDAGTLDAGSGVDAGGEEDGGATDAGGGEEDAGPEDAGPEDAGPPPNPLEGLGEVRTLDTGYMFLEGPVWRPGDGDLLFSDIPAQTIYRFAPPDTFEPFRTEQDSNGLLLDLDGELLIAGHGGRAVWRLADGSLEVLAERFEGQRLHSPNDLDQRSDGTIYFTDPPFAVSPGDRELDFVGVFRIDPEGALTAEWRGALDTRPNGIALSPDESTLYVAESRDQVLYAFPVEAGGALGEPATLADTAPTGDGMAVDVRGNVYLTTREGVEVYAPDGTQWGTIEVPEVPANCAFGGAERQTLYITARTGLYAVDTPLAGLP